MPVDLGYLIDTSDGEPPSPSMVNLADSSDGFPQSASVYHLRDTSNGIRFLLAAQVIGYRVDTSNGDSEQSSVGYLTDTSFGLRFSAVVPPSPPNRQFTILIVRV